MQRSLDSIRSDHRPPQGCYDLLAFSFLYLNLLIKKIMDYGYLRSYRQKKINHHKLHAKILDLFRESGESVDKLRLYDEVLFILD